ncbi:glycoside hydrolase family 25 protein [Streptococcus sp. 10F2]
MRQRINPIYMAVFFGFIFLSLIAGHNQVQFLKAEQEAARAAKATEEAKKKKSETKKKKKTTTENVNLRPIVDLSGWQLPEEIDYDAMAAGVSGAIIRVHSGAQAKKENAATYLNGIDKSYQKHIEEFKKRDIPVAVYAYVAAGSVKEMQKEAEEFYQASAKYKPTYYWLDVEEKTMSNMDKGVEAFRVRLQELGAKNIGIYIGTYFMEEHSISTDKFDAVWFPTYGVDSGYYNAAPSTDIDYDLHQYTSRGWLPGFDKEVDLNQISPLKNTADVYKKLFQRDAVDYQYQNASQTE